METIIYIAVILIMLAGVAGTVLPLLPGIPVIFVAALGYGWYQGFTEVSGQYLAILGGIALISMGVDYAASAYGTKRFGATKYASWGSVIGGIAGIFIIPPLGILIGSWLGAVGGELLAGRASQEALRAGTGALIGLLSGMAVKLIIAIGMLISFIVVTI